MNPLIIGGSGPTGRALSYKFNSLGIQATRICRTPTGLGYGKEINIDLEKNLNLNLDLYSHVIYAAQARNYKESPTDYRQLTVINSLIPSEIAAECKRLQKNFVYFSTGSVYAFSEIEINEMSERKQNSELDAYSASKIFGEEMVGFHNSESLLIRPFYIFGENAGKNSLLGSLVHNLKNGNEIRISKGGGIKLQAIGANEVAGALIHLILNNWSGPFNICSTNEIKLRELIEFLSGLLDVRPNLIEVDQVSHQTRISNAKLLSTGYNFQTELFDYLTSIITKA